MNEASILSLLKDKERINNETINEAIGQIITNNEAKSKLRISRSKKPNITFKDVAGNEEAKEEMQELVDFLKNPQKYADIGASIPKGVLLTGPPGTGKTLLAQALAGETKVPFWVTSGSKFVEMYVGVGAARVRNLFQEARAIAPCIIFIDEIDALGGQRSNVRGNGHNEESDQALNQLLTEMDGFSKNTGIIVIGATNRVDVIDSALLRPGRFDRQLKVNKPDVLAREAILKIHAQNKKIAEEIDFKAIAKKTQSFNGAQLQATMNEAALLSARYNKEMITNEEIEQAIDKIITGPSERSSYRITPKDKNVTTFADVAGNEEEKEEMQELIDFLKNPEKYQDIGASIPKGILLQGPPGTGKTLLAKAVAGEADVPYFVTSGSDFVEKYVGVGASRLRALFEEARQNMPCVIFIDEIEVLGGKRHADANGGSQERDQTLNQLLTEMDGFAKTTGIIVIGATNRADMLDSALLRPGRFDRHFTISLPTVEAREKILAVHAKNKKMAAEVNFHQLAKYTIGMSRAQLASVLNEASILTVRNKKTEITMVEIEEAIDRVMMGTAKKYTKYEPEEKKMVAYHEAGHAVIVLKLEHAPKVQKVTIIPRGSAGGYNLMMPDKETLFFSKNRMLAQITTFLGGRAAEELMFDDISNGTYSDFKYATQIATQMVTKLGMSDLGPVQDSVFSDKQAVDAEIKKIVNNSLEKARQIIVENKPLLEKIAHELLEKETINKEDLENLL